jgi:hypothetical protein
MGTRITDVDSLLVGQSVPLVPSVRRSNYAGAGQYDITDDGTLVYVPGINAGVGRLVQVRRDGRLVPLPLPEAAFLRFTPSPDGLRLAAVVEGVQQQELRVYDLRTGAYDTHARGFFIGPPAWSADGNRLAYKYADEPNRDAVVELRLDSPEAPRVLLARDPPAMMQVSGYLGDMLLVGSNIPGLSAMLVDPTASPPRIDSLGLSSLHLSISPDRRWLAYQPQGTTEIYLQPWPARDRRYLIDGAGFEPRWTSAAELVYLRPTSADSSRSVALWRLRVDASRRPPVGERELVVRDSRFADTPGWSHASTTDGGLIYLQTPDENLGYYFRAVPGWVTAMKRAVEGANR